MKEKTAEDQIGILNTMVCIRLAPSPIHGIGVFAVRDIPQGTKLYADNMPEIFSLPYENFDKLRPEIQDILLERWPLIVKGSAFIYPDARMVAYMNHSEDANYDAKEDRTLRDIKAGEEVTEDYKKIAGWETVHTWLA